MQENKKIQLCTKLWDRIKNSKGNTTQIKHLRNEFLEVKSESANFVVDILFEEIDYYKNLCNNLIEKSERIIEITDRQIELEKQEIEADLNTKISIWETLNLG